MNIDNFFETIINKEYNELQNAHNKYGDYFHNTLSSIRLLEDLIIDIPDGLGVFLCGISKIRTHGFLSLMSLVRKHKIEGMMNLRYILEFACFSAYAINHQDLSYFFQNPDKPNYQEKIIEYYDWLKNNYPTHNDFIKNTKDIINNNYAHANLSWENCSIHSFGNTNLYELSFFDVNLNDEQIKEYIRNLGSTILSIILLFIDINNVYKILNLKEEFINDFHILAKKSNELKKRLILEN